MNNPTLRPGQTVLFQRRPCQVLRVNDCSALIAIPQPPRTITTRFGKSITIQPKPALARIAPDSDIPVL